MRTTTKVTGTRLKHVLMSLAVMALLVIAMGVAAMAVSTATAFADEEYEPVKYMDWDEKTGKLVEKICTDYEIVTFRALYNPKSGRVELNDGKWYVVYTDVSFEEQWDIFDRRIVVNGSAHLILMDGKTMNAALGIRLCNERTSEGKIIKGCLTIYGQSEGTGSLTTSADSWKPFAAIGGEGGDSGLTYCDAGKLVINGGHVSALSNSRVAAIGGAGKGSGGEVVVNHGTLHVIGLPEAHQSRNYPAFGPGPDSENAEDTRITVNKDLVVTAGPSEDELEDVTDTFSEKHDQQFVHIGPAKTVTATFKVKNGKWNDKTSADKTYSFRTSEGTAKAVPAEELPAVGNEPDTHYKPEGSWSPSIDAKISEDTTFTYTYDGYVPEMSIGSGVLGTGCNTADAATVSFGNNSMFGDNRWRVIGYAGDGIASMQLNMTLLSDGILDTTLFDEPDSNNIAYCKSILKTRVDAAAEMLSEREKSVVVPRTLISSDENAYINTDWVTGGEVKDAVMWPLSTKEAFNTDPSIRMVDPEHTGMYDDDYWWWLRSAGYNRTGATSVSAAGNVGTSDSPVAKGYIYGVRPAFNVKLGGILFTSLAEGGKISDSIGADALMKVGTTSDTSWKLTLRDGSRYGFAAQAEQNLRGVYTIKYADAMTGENEYISAVVADSKGYIIYYGRIKKLKDAGDASGEVEINTKGKLAEGDRLYVFSEQYNGDNKTDLASAPQEIEQLEEAPIPVTKIRFKTLRKQIAKGEELQLELAIQPDDAASKAVTWTSSDESVLTVSDSGLVNGIKEGTAKVTATAADGSGVKASKAITITHVHDLVPMPAVLPTCTTDGNREHWKCSSCGRLFGEPHGVYEVTEEDILIPAHGHDWGETVQENRKEATCTKIGGYDVVKRCNFCNEVLMSNHVVIPAQGHQWGNWDETPAEEGKDGERTRKCSACELVETEIIPALDHEHAMEPVNKVSATCVENGTKAHWKCSKCKNCYEDEAGTVQLTSDDLLIPATGKHTKGEVEKIDESDPTCTTAGGYTEITYCSVCKNEIARGATVIPALGHEWSEVSYKWSDDNSVVTATRTCANDSSHVESEAAGTTSEITAPSTCTEKGKTRYTAVFDNIDFDEQVKEADDIDIDPNAHDWGAWVVTTPATEEAEGVETRTCNHDPAHMEKRAIPKVDPSQPVDPDDPFNPVGPDDPTPGPDPAGPVSIDNAKVVLSSAAFTYNGKILKPTIKTIGGDALTFGTDYQVAWSNVSSKNVGTYTITITGEGNYTGITTAKYKINPKGTKLRKPKVIRKTAKKSAAKSAAKKKATKAKKTVIVRWKRQTKKMSKSRITGYQIQIATNKKFTKGRKLYTVKGYRRVSRKIKNLKGRKKYFIRIRTYKTLKGAKLCSKWSKRKTAR